MNHNNLSWERKSRRVVYDTPHMQVYEDCVRLPGGHIIDDYSVANLPDGIIIIATDKDNNLIIFDEYKYAVNETILTLPAGGMDGDESPVQAAARELLEETGYESTDFELIGEFYVYPSKIQHTNYMVRAKNAKKIKEIDHEATETIGEVQLIPISKLKKLRLSGKFNTTPLITALALAFPETF